MATKILVLGHKGMLGNAVHTYFTTQTDHEVTTINDRFGDERFNDALRASDANVIINCIGAIPQKKPTEEVYKTINVDLPIFLETLGKKIIHPTTDCEFSGSLAQDEMYSTAHSRDAEDVYGKSKATIAELIEKNFKNTKMIRVSIIGHELNSNYSFLDWFLNASDTVNGYQDHYWNGITTLQWAKLASNMINDWEGHPTLNQYATSPSLSKYEMLELAKRIYSKDITINPILTGKVVNKCLRSSHELPTLEEQLRELKKVYNK